MKQSVDCQKLQGLEFQVDGQGVLSVRESQTLAYLAQGDIADEIAAAMHITTRTVIAHREHIKDKLLARNVQHAISTAFALGMLKVVPKAAPQLLIALVLSGTFTDITLQRGARLPTSAQTAVRIRRRTDVYPEPQLYETSSVA